MSEQFTAANPTAGNLAAAEVRRQRALAKNTVTSSPDLTPGPNEPLQLLKGASEGGVAIQPDTVVNRNTGAVVDKGLLDDSWIGNGQTRLPLQNQIAPSPQTKVSSEPSPIQTQPSNQVNIKPVVASGFDMETLKRTGLSDAEIQRLVDIKSPLLDYYKKSENNNQQLYDFEQKAADDLYKQNLNVYSNQKQIAENLKDESKQLIDFSAQVQSGFLEQQKANEQHLIEQEKKLYELSRTREERRIMEENLKREEDMIRDLAGGTGLAFSSFGARQLSDIRLKGDEILSDARSMTAYGNAEFAFRLQDIEREYGNKMNLIEGERRNLQLQNLNKFQEEIKDIDSKILLSAKEKKEAAVQATKDLFQRKDKIDAEIARFTSTVVEDAYTRVAEIEKEKKEAEMTDLELSQAYGYFVNKWGEPVNKQANGQPTRFSSGYDRELSSQMGYLVDKYGRAITNDKGGKISYTDPEIVKFNNALASLKSGTATQGDMATLNYKYGVNSAITGALVDGKVYTSPKYGYLQCGEFINNEFLKTRMLGSDYANANQLIAQYGGKRGVHSPQIGDVVFMDLGIKGIPHKAIIGGIDDKGNLLLTDANRVKPGMVKHNWAVSPNDKRIYGYARLPLKDNVLAKMPMMTPNSSTDGGGSLYDMTVKAAAMKQAGINDSLVAKMLGLEDKDGKKNKEDTPGAIQNKLITAKSEKDAAQMLVNEGYINPDTGYVKLLGDTTESERASASAAAKVYEAENVLKAYENANMKIGDVMDFFGAIQINPDGNISSLAFNKALNSVQDPSTREILKAVQRYTEGKLRKESGAAIGVSEYVSTAKMFFPEPGDTQANIKNLKAARTNILKGLVNQSGNAIPIYYSAIYGLGDVEIDRNVQPKTVGETVGKNVQQTQNNIISGATNWLNNLTKNPNQNTESTNNYFGQTDAVIKQEIDYLRKINTPEDQIKIYLNKYYGSN